MTTATPCYVVDSKGKKVAVLLEVEEYRKLIERAGEMETLRGFAAKSADDSNAVYAESSKGSDEFEALGLRSFP